MASTDSDCETVRAYAADGSTRGVVRRGECMDPERTGLYGESGNVLFYRVEGTKYKFAVAKRAATKKRWPGHWDFTAAGMIQSGESVKAGTNREVEEELGVQLKESQLRLLLTFNPQEYTCGTTRFVAPMRFQSVGTVFVVKWDDTPISFNTDDIESIEWRSEEELAAEQGPMKPDLRGFLQSFWYDWFVYQRENK